MIRLSEALILGAISQPLCHGAFFDNQRRRVCLLTAAVRTCGRKPKRPSEVLRDCMDLWPWVAEVQVCPAVSTVGAVGMMTAPALCWIVDHFDRCVRIEWIADQIRQLEDHIAHMAAAGKLFDAVRERRPKPEGASPYALRDLSHSDDDSRGLPSARPARSVLASALALGRAAERAGGDR